MAAMVRALSMPEQVPRAQRDAEPTPGFVLPMPNRDGSKGLYLTHMMSVNVVFNPQKEQRRR